MVGPDDTAVLFLMHSYNSTMYKNLALSKDEFKGQRVDGKKFEACHFRGVVMRFSEFNKCEFVGCDFSGCTFDQTWFSTCSFPESKLSNQDFREVEFEKCDFKNAVVVNSVFQKFRNGETRERRKWDLRSCKFVETDLSGTVFAYCVLTKLKFERSLLERTVFENCDLRGADFTNANISGASFEKSLLSEVILDIDGFIKYGNSKGFVLSSDESA